MVKTNNNDKSANNNEDDVNNNSINKENDDADDVFNGQIQNNYQRLMQIPHHYWIKSESCYVYWKRVKDKNYGRTSNIIIFFEIELFERVPTSRAFKYSVQNTKTWLWENYSLYFLITIVH